MHSLNLTNVEGPILSTKLGLRTIDVGNAQLSMHSIREVCSSADIASSIRLFEVCPGNVVPISPLQAVYRDFEQLDADFPN